MKILKNIWGISLLATLLIVAAPRVTFAQDDEVITEQDFYDALAPYGTWVYDNTYGDVWLPDVDEDFRPYQTAGYWVMTEYGNTWVSDYAWGWATFHYGRWRFDDYYGWEWIPGYEWAPAWVSWRSGDGYYGWAPLSPDIDFSMSIGTGNYDYYWAFAPAAYINNQSIYSYYIPHTRVHNIIRHTTVVNNVFVRNGRQYMAGPRATDIERYTHRRPKVYTVTNARRPGITVGTKTVSIFRPNVSRSPNAQPQRVIDASAYQRQNPNQRIAREGGGLTFSRNNAQRLAMEARSSNPNTNVVRVNGQPAVRVDQPSQSPQRRPQSAGAVSQRQSENAVQLQRGSASSAQQQPNRASQPQQNNNTATRQPYRSRPEGRPNVTPQKIQEQANGQVQRPQQATQQAQPRGQAHRTGQQAEQHRPQFEHQAAQQKAEQQRQAQQQAEQQRQAQQQAEQQRQAQQQAEQQRRGQQQAEQQRQAQQQAEQQRQAQQQAEQQRRGQQQAEQQRQAQQQAAQQQAAQRQAQQQQQQHRRPPERRPQ